MPENTQEIRQLAYKEALMDVYLFLTGDERIAQYPERLSLIENMISQVNTKPNRLAEAA